SLNSGAYFFWFTAMFIHALFIVVYDLNMTPVPMSTFYTNLQYIEKVANKHYPVRKHTLYLGVRM
ncbi:hypothetical protein ACQCVJ_22035, partial [Bacillus infantis]